MKSGQRRTPVDAATLRAPVPLAGDVLRAPEAPTVSGLHIRVESDVTIANVRLAPSLVILRCRARNVRACALRAPLDCVC